jgi:hypothetical protein
MKEGDIVVCINAGVYGNKHFTTITDGKHYEVYSVWSEEEDGGATLYVAIRNDRGNMDQFMAKRFKLLSDIREEKLKELGLLDECPIPNERV